MKEFSEALLFDWPLTPDSVVLDVGGHDGNFTGILSERFNPHIHVFEPVPEFVSKLVDRFWSHQKIHLWPFGLGATDRTQELGVKGSMSGEFCADRNSTITVSIRSLKDFLKSREIDAIDLLAINAEGAEFEILEHAINEGLMPRIRNLVVQPHAVVPDYAARWDAICEHVGETHEMLFNAPWCWVGWRIKA